MDERPKTEAYTCIEESAEEREARRIAEQAEFGGKSHTRGVGMLVSLIAAGWSVFQLALASVLMLDSVLVRAIHLAFAIALIFLCRPWFRKPKKSRFLQALSRSRAAGALDGVLAVGAAAAALYIVFEYHGLSERQGALLPRDIAAGCLLIFFVLEAVRRSFGLALPTVAGVFIAYSFLGPRMPAVLAFKGVSLHRFIGQITASTEGIYGIPLDVSATIVFLFVLFGAMLESAGAGRFFVTLAFSLLGRYRGGPAKAAVLASGLTGLVSGSSIANVVTTGTFTIPMMKRAGYPAHKAAAVEVACSTNGQLMPPVMGAAAFIIAEYCNLAYLDVVRAAFIPAVISFIALMYITHLEALKLGIQGMPKDQVPPFRKTLIGGLHYFLPILVLIYELVIMRRSPQLAAFRAILLLAVIIVLQNMIHAGRDGHSIGRAFLNGLRQIAAGLVAGGKGMMGIGVAVAAAGIIVGVITLGLGGIIAELIETLSGESFLLVLVLTAITGLLLGMGLPTTANYIVMASLTAPIIVTLGAKAGVVFPLIAAHLFVFFFGILADDTPPVGLASFAASAIAKSDPVKTGFQAFGYDIRTALLPFMFIFNADLLLVDIHHPVRIAWVFFTALAAMFAFAALTQGFFRTRNRLYESAALAIVVFVLLRPYYTAEIILGLPAHMHYLTSAGALLLFAGVYALQWRRRVIPTISPNKSRTAVVGSGML